MTLTNFPNGVSVSGVELVMLNKFVVTADLSSATWNTAAAHEIAVVSGLVRMQILALVTDTGDDTSGNTSTISLGVAGDVASLIAATQVDDLAAGEIWYDATPTTKTDKWANAVIDFPVDSIDVGYTIAAEAATAGEIEFHIWWLPLEDGATVTAGTGGAFA